MYWRCVEPSVQWEVWLWCIWSRQLCQRVHLVSFASEAWQAAAHCETSERHSYWPCMYVTCRGMRKTKYRFKFGFKITKPSKNLTSIQTFSNRNCMESAIHTKSVKNNFAFIQCADKERFKTQPDDTRCDCYSLLTTLSKSAMHSSHNIAVTL